MAWVIGIDEAGYGPNLGPFVMSAWAVQLPEALARTNLWQTLQAGVRTLDMADPDRLVVADSKAVYASSSGLRNLETNLLACTWEPTAPPANLSEFLAPLGPEAVGDLALEPWYVGTTALPKASVWDSVCTLRTRWQSACAALQVRRAFVQAVVICPTRFNALTMQANSKGAVLGFGFTQLVRAAWEQAEPGETLYVYVDKHGGRNSYAALVQHTVPAGLVLAEVESRERSVYRVEGATHQARLTFQPRADSEHFCVAAASMLSKYIRELCMHEFNAYWQKHLADLKPTAGYPVDAARFLADISAVLPKVKIPLDSLWRRR